MRGLDLTGQRFGRLVVIEESGRRGVFKLWHCICDCGNETYVTTNHLRYGDTKSCGCYNREHQRELHNRHGMTKTRLHTIWRQMRRRCTDPKHSRYHRYGKRGITYCDEWNSFENFRDWALTHGYSDDKSIDRIDNDKNYCPENCTWSTPKEQARNRSTSHYEHGKTLAEWAELLNVDYRILQQRISYGLTLEEALTKPVRCYKDRPSYIPCPNFKLEDWI